MTSEQQRIAIGEWVGWQRGTPRWNFGRICNARFETAEQLPDFCGDLNVIHEAEKHLAAHQWSEYRLTLTEVCTHYRLADWQGYAINASAAQRAEALLRTLGLWHTDQEPAAAAKEAK